MPRDIPRADQAEQAVIGCLLLRGSPDEHALAEIPDLKPTDFWLQSCATIFQVCLDLARSDGAIDQVLVAQRLQELDKLASIGGPAFLIHCLRQVETSYHLKFYAAAVLDCSRRRDMLAQAGQLARAAFNPVTPPLPPPSSRGPVKGL